MASNQNVNKVVYAGTTLIDLTGDDVTAGDVLSGKKFHLASGAAATGTMPNIGEISGILKGDGAGNVSAATAGTDYATPAQVNAKYTKPSGGIPASDLASGVIPTVPSASSTTPKMDGTASTGSGTTWAKGDHVHPTDTSRQAKITASGILKGNGAGNVSAATADTDYATPASINAILSAIAPLENTYAASRNYRVGDFLFVGKKFYRVVANIASGGSITPGTNAVETTVAGHLLYNGLQFLSQSGDTSVAAGSSFTLSVEVNKANVTYQWQYFRPDGGPNHEYVWTNWLNSTQNTLTKTASSNWNMWKNRCIVTDADGYRIISDDMILRVT